MFSVEDGDDDDDEDYDNELRNNITVNDGLMVTRLSEHLSNSRLSLASIATVYEQDLLDDRQGMNDESQIAQNESSSRRSFDGSVFSNDITFASRSHHQSNYHNHHFNNNRQLSRVDNKFRAASSDGVGFSSRFHRSNSTNSTLANATLSRLNGTARSSGKRVKLATNGPSNSSTKRRHHRTKSRSSSSSSFFCGGRTSKRRRGIQSKWLKRFKLRKRHKSIEKLQLSLMNFNVISIKKLDKDLQSFLPKRRLNRQEFDKRVSLMKKYEVLADIEYGFAEKHSEYLAKHASLAANQCKNNYKKYVPYDYNRVVLKTLPDIPHSDYVNASHIDSLLKTHAYIAAQGPNEETVADFWRMIWEQKSFVIIMLTKVFDFIKVMCNQYWPIEINKVETYGNFEVTLLYEEPLADFVIRTIKLRKIKSSKHSQQASNTENASNQQHNQSSSVNRNFKPKNLLERKLAIKDDNEEIYDDEYDNDGDDDDADDNNNDNNSNNEIEKNTNTTVSRYLQVRKPKFLRQRESNNQKQSNNVNISNRSSVISSEHRSPTWDCGNFAALNSSNSATINARTDRTASIVSFRSSSQGPPSPSQRSNATLRTTASSQQRLDSSTPVAELMQKQNGFKRQSLLVDNAPKRTVSSSNLFLHPNMNLSCAQLNSSMSSVLSASLSDLQPGTPTTPLSDHPPVSPTPSGIDRTSATRKAVKKKRREPTLKNLRPARTQFLAPSESQLLDDDEDDVDDATTTTTIASATIKNSIDVSGKQIKPFSHKQTALQGSNGDGEHDSNFARRSINSQKQKSSHIYHQATANDSFDPKASKKKKGSRERIVYQFHYRSWPSHTCPYISSLLHFRRRVRICMDEMSKAGNIGPTIVHCNDGCGRTGTYLCIDSNLELVEEDNCYDIYHYTRRMRQLRKYLIENKEQYKFVYETINDAAVCGKTWFPVAELHTRLKYKGQRNPPTKTNEYQREYEKISQMAGRFSIGDCAGGHRVENRLKNRDVSTVPPDNFRPYLTSFQSNDNTDYINAVFVDGYTRDKEYIVTEWPMHRTISDFWSLIYDHDCNSIILLANPDESSNYPSFLPSEKELRRKFGPVFSAEMVSYTHYQNIKSWIYTINRKNVSLTDLMAKVKSETKTTQVFQITCWPQGHRVPTSTNALVELMNMVERWRQRTTYGPVCVVSLDGKSRAGVYCAANVAIEQVVQHNEVDVFHAVRTVRRHRPQLVENMTEYKYCYDLILHYVLFFLKPDSD